MFMRFTRAVAVCWSLPILIIVWYWFVWIGHYFAVEHLDCFQSLALKMVLPLTFFNVPFAEYMHAFLLCIHVLKYYK